MLVHRVADACKALEVQQAIKRLAWLKPGDTVYATLRHRSASGISRVYDLVVIEDSKPKHIGFNTARALGWTYDFDREGVRVAGTGMDMGFHLVYTLSGVLFRGGFDCTGNNCPSNDHLNGDHDYSLHHHADGGYALIYSWM